MNKDLIQKRFGQNLSTYNNNAKIQRIMVDQLLSYLNTRSYNKILEIGCGTGLLTTKLINKINFQHYIANDIVENCQDYIKNINSEIIFIHSDIERYINDKSNEKYDLIISNAAFQWIENIENFINTLYTKLNPNGILLFSTFGTNNFSEIYKITQNTLAYKSKKYYENILKNKQYEINEETYILTFNKAIDVLKHLKYTGVNSVSNNFWTKSDMKNFENRYNAVCSGIPTLTYNPIYIKITKI